jgi:two-component system, response regulator PdtaR
MAHWEAEPVHALIIEDEFLTALTLEDLLLELGVETCDWAATEAAAIDAADRHAPDLIAANIQLRHGDGIELVREICEDRNIPIILVSATDVLLRDEVDNAVIVPKPLTEHSFRAAFERVCGRKVDAEPQFEFYS